MSENKIRQFRELDSAFQSALKEGILNPILKFESKHKKSFTAEIRKNFLNLYFLGHGIDSSVTVQREET